MKIGVPKEIKNGEYRVALTPDSVAELIVAGHQVGVQTGAGLGSGYDDALYQSVGANIRSKAADIWDAELIVKVKEPLLEEYPLLRPGLGLVTFLHLAGVPQLADVLLKKRVRSIGYETVQLEDGSLPLLAPMSQVAGRVAMLYGAQFLQKNSCANVETKGLLLGGIVGIPAAVVVIVGGGNVGLHAAQVAVGLGAKVMILDRNLERLSYLNGLFEGKIRTCEYSLQLLQQMLPACDVLIGATLMVGEHAAQLLTQSMIATMQKGSVFVDVAIDQGGISETSRVTSYDAPVYEIEGVIHCCLPNLPATVPRSSTQALNIATLPYVKLLAGMGLEPAIAADFALSKGINTWDGELCHDGVIKALKEFNASKCD